MEPKPAVPAGNGGGAGAGGNAAAAADEPLCELNAARARIAPHAMTRIRMTLLSGDSNRSARDDSDLSASGHSDGSSGEGHCGLGLLRLACRLHLQPSTRIFCAAVARLHLGQSRRVMDPSCAWIISSGWPGWSLACSAAFPTSCTPPPPSPSTPCPALPLLLPSTHRALPSIPLPSATVVRVLATHGEAGSAVLAAPRGPPSFSSPRPGPHCYSMPRARAKSATQDHQEARRPRGHPQERPGHGVLGGEGSTGVVGYQEHEPRERL